MTGPGEDTWVYRSREKAAMPCYFHVDKTGMVVLEERSYFEHLPPDGTRVGLDVSVVPEGFRLNTVRALLMFGKFEELTIETDGIAVRDSILGQLKTKFGEPADLREEEFETRGGRKYVSVNASWLFENYVAIFISMERSLDQGVFLVRTTKGQEFAERENALKPKL